MKQLIRKILKEVTSDVELLETSNADYSWGLYESKLVRKKSVASKQDERNFLKYFDGLNIDDIIDDKRAKKDIKKTKQEIKYLEDLPNDEKFVKKYDKVEKIFKDYLNENDLEINEKKLKDISGGARYFIMKLKNHYGRPRPNEVKKDIKYVKLRTTSTPSYPSGHTIQSKILALILSDYFPKHRGEFMKLANRIAKSRLIGREHFPSDVNYGKELADILFKQYKKNQEENEEELNEYSRTLKNARRQGVGLRFSKSAVNANPSRFRNYNK